MKICSSKFYFYKEQSSFIGEMKAIFPHDVPTEFIMVSKNTGEEIIWKLTNKIFTGYNDVVGWEFSPAPETLQKSPHLNRIYLSIFDD